MGTLALTLDFPQKVVSQPGYHATTTAPMMATLGTPRQDDHSMHQLWADPATATVMLRPLQLRPDWLATTQQLPFVVRINQLTINGGDLSSGAIREEACFGNTADPWIYHWPVGPSLFFPTAPEPGEELPRTPPSVLGISTPVNPTTTDLTVVRPNPIFAQPTIVPDPTLPPPTPVLLGGTADGRHLVQSARFPANQGFYFRWYHPPSRIGFPLTYSFYVGQFRLDVRDVVLQIFHDNSAQGDRSSWKHVATAPLFSVGDYSLEGIRFGWAAKFNPAEILAHDRSLLWLPYRRNQVLLLASTGKYHLLQVQPTTSRLPDGSDWAITRSDTLMVWCLSPSWGRFQIQKLAYTTGDSKAQIPVFTLPFIPTSPPTVTPSADTDHGTSIAAAISNPPSYTIPVNNVEDCPAVPGNIATIQARTYGIELTLNTPDANWTPFLYAVDAGSPVIFDNPPTSPTTVNDLAGAAHIVAAEFSCGIAPGESRGKVEVQDVPPYTLTNYYYRSGQPVQITLDGTPVFTGITQPQEVVPLKQSNTVMRRISFTAFDRWAQLEAYYLRDQRTWAGVGHIDVVKTICQQCGIDTTTFNSPPVNAVYNTLLGGPSDSGITVAQISGHVEPAWKPRGTDTGASFIRRIAQFFSGWDFFFTADGVPNYYPKQYFSTPEFTFWESKAAAAAGGDPNGLLYRAPVSFTTIEPEANIIYVKASSAQDSSPLYSSVWIDYASLFNKNAVNYVGRPKTELIDMSLESFTCMQLNWAARKIWERTRRRWVIARFDADFTANLKQGHAFTLHPYGNYRVISYSGHFRKRSWDQVTIEAEFIESGVGLSSVTPGVH